MKAVRSMFIADSSSKLSNYQHVQAARKTFGETIVDQEGLRYGLLLRYFLHALTTLPFNNHCRSSTAVQRHVFVETPKSCWKIRSARFLGVTLPNHLVFL